jgi:hypothetical protein
MAWSTEKDIRLFILTKLSISSDEILGLYRDLEIVLPEKSIKIQVPGKLAA